MHTLLGHLAFRRFTPQVEDLATEALGYVLSRSEAARGAIKLHVARCGVVLPDQLSYETQSVGASEERPDLVGRTNQGEEPLLIEAKFWAGLTEHQPDTYLRRLPPGGALLFVVPEKRLHSVWNELLVRCDDAKVARMTREVTGNDLIAVALEDRKTLAITSWRRLLDDVHHATRDADEPQLAQDVVQLQGLCDQMDDEGAFLPIRDDELTSKHYRRILDFSRLPEDALNKLVASRTADRAGLKQGSGFGYRGCYFQLQGAGVLLAFSLNQWLKRGMTPIWLTVLGDCRRSSETA